jgi:hypothetical protein
MDEATSSEATASYSFDVFLSYAHENGSFARDLVEWLRRAGYKVLDFSKACAKAVTWWQC